MCKVAIPALPEGYADWLTQLKGGITQARQRAVLAVNADTLGRNLPSIPEIEAELAGELDTGSDVE